jgi:delta 1-pyrroline-5-carboxylate dehydrogenase
MANKCGAKTRAGGRCQQAGMPNGRCRYHGGLSTGPRPGSQNALKHGIYAKEWTEEEVEVSRHVQVSSLDDEIRLTAIRLRRALAAEAAAQGKPELEEITEHDLIGQEGSRQDIKSKVRDYVGIIDRLTGRLESLKKTRLLLRIELGLTDEDMSAELTHGTPDEAAPANPIR